MPNSINKVILVGNLGQEPEVRHGNNGNKIVTFSVATSESWKDKATGERKDQTEWHRVVIFSPGLADIAEKYVHKGSRVYVEGQLRTRKWQDNSGNDRYSTEVVLSAFNGTLVLMDRSGDAGASFDVGGQAPDMGQSGAAPEQIDDEIPF